MTIRLITVKPEVFVLCYNMGMGNTVGSRTRTLHESEWAYIAGFFDGDGSLIVQIKNRRDTTRGWRIMFTICFYQDSRHKQPLEWMREILNAGYISDRNDGITELRINGYGQVKQILSNMHPYIRFKSKQVAYALKMLEVLENQSFLSLPINVRFRLATWFNKLRAANYKSHHKSSDERVLELLTK